MSKKLTLNAEKRKAIADVFQVHFEQNSKFKEQHTNAEIEGFRIPLIENGLF